ncbi:MAG: hypothetical protein K5756_06860 [Clostridiales bacterium]|nr:hypothetical protein [Clostridiales bacterium]
MIGPIQKFFSLILVTLMMNFSSMFCGAKADIKTISDNVTDGLLNGTMATFGSADLYGVDEIISLISYDGDGNCFFADIDYSDEARAMWPAAKHLNRTERLAIVYRLERDNAKKAEYKDIVLKLINHWIKKDYQNPNWWYNKLSNPNVLGEIGILMKPDLSADQLKKLSVLVGRGCFLVDPVLRAYTGANAVDISMSSIKFGVLTGNGSAIRSALRVVAGELDYGLVEGIKKDGTFFQHGERLYMGGYGIEFIKGISNVVGMISGTKYMFSGKQLTPFSEFILTGLRKMSFGNTLDPTTMGRSVSRINAQPLTAIVPDLVRLANTEGMPGRNEIMEYAVSIANNTKNNYGLHYYDKANFLVVNNEDFYFSFLGGNSKMFYSEITNDENILSYNSSFPGVTTIMHTGNELTNISPLYNYSLIPGTTAVYESDEELAARKDPSYRLLPGTYGSQTAEGAAVVFAKTKHENISMTVSCFATDNAVILLGTGMKNSDGKQMFTTLDQSYYAGSFRQDGNTVIHNGIKYELLQGGSLCAGSEHRVGNWRRNNLTMPDAYAEGDVFTVFFANSGSYAYSVMSENTQADFEVIMNTEKIQAVKLPDGRIAAVFLSAGSFDYDGSTYKGLAGNAYIFG